MKIEFIPFKAEHFEQIEKRPERDEDEILWIKSRLFLVNDNPTVTMLVDGVIKACGGCIYLWPHTAEFWAITAPDIKQYREAFNEFVLNLISDITQAFKLTRLQATVKEDFAVGHRWIEFLGFKFETKMPNYFFNKTYWLYSKIVEE